MWMRVIALKGKILIFKVKNRVTFVNNLHARKGAYASLYLELGLVKMVAIKMGIAEGVYEVSHFKFEYMGDHHGEQCVGGDVKGYS